MYASFLSRFKLTECVWLARLFLEFSLILQSILRF